MRLGAYAFDPEHLTLALGKERVEVPARALEVLRVLAETPNRVVDKRTIFARVWPDGFVEENNLWQQVHLLRRALAADPRVRIENVPRRGYRLDVPRVEVDVRRRIAFAAAAIALIAGVASLALWVAHPRTAALSDAGMQAYRRGLYHLARRQPVDLTAARAYFDTTIALAPDAPDGYAARALLDIVQAQRASRPARADALYTASLVDERAAFARGEHPYALLARAARTRSRADFERASALAPDDATVASWYGFFELASGDPTKAERIEARASRLDPSAPIPLKLLGIAAYYAHDYRVAAAAFHDELGVYSADDEGWYYLGLAEQARLRPEAAGAAFSRAVALRGGLLAGARLAGAYLDAVSGHTIRAKATLAIAGPRPKAGYGREGIDVAALWMAFGRPDAALSALEHIDRRDPLVAVAIEADPRLQSLPFRRDARN